MAFVSAKPKVVSTERKVSRFVQKQFPQHFALNESNIIDFVEAYYEWAEQTGQFQDDINKLLDFQDIDETTEEFISFFRDEFIPCIPREALVDERLFIKHARDFYRARGSEKSFKLLFRILFNEDLDIEFAKDLILKPSDGNWSTVTSAKATANDPNIEDIHGRKIVGLESGATAIVETVEVIQAGGLTTANLTLSGAVGTFVRDEIFETRSTTTALPKIRGRFFGIVADYTITNPGTGYTEGEIIPLSSTGDGFDFAAVISGVNSDGGIEIIRFLNTGVDFEDVAPVADLSSLSGTGGGVTFSLGAVHTSDGEYVSNRGKISSDPRLQDGKFFQQYSYILKSGRAVDTYRDIVKKLLHPAGMFFSGEITSIGQGVDGEIFDVIRREFFALFIKIYAGLVTVEELARHYPTLDYNDLLNLFLHRFITDVKVQIAQDENGNQLTGIPLIDIFPFISLGNKTKDFFSPIIGDFATDEILLFQNTEIQDLQEAVESETSYPKIAERLVNFKFVFDSVIAGIQDSFQALELILAPDPVNVDDIQNHSPTQSLADIENNTLQTYTRSLRPNRTFSPINYRIAPDVPIVQMRVYFLYQVEDEEILETEDDQISDPTIPRNKFRGVTTVELETTT